MFFQSDCVFDKYFVEVLQEVMAIERSSSCVLLNLTSLKSANFNHSEASYIEIPIIGEKYDRLLREGGAADGWLFGVDEYSCASNVGEWVVYSDRSADISVVSIRFCSNFEAIARTFGKLQAELIEKILFNGENAQFPFCNLLDSWRYHLGKNYASRRLD